MKFFPDIVSVEIDRPGADVQYTRNLLAGFSGFDEVRHLDFRRSQCHVNR
jgi:hypothetical protein